MPAKYINLIKKLRSCKKFVLDLLFPIECLGCGQEDVWLCESCLTKIKLRQLDECVVCRRPAKWGKTDEGCRGETYLDGLIVPAVFEDKLLAEAIHKFKYNFIADLQAPLGKILINKLNNFAAEENQPNPVGFLLLTEAIIAPVPLAKKRLAYRDFNQAELLGRQVAEKFKLTMRSKLLKRVKNTKPQTELKREKRLINLAGAFALNETLGEQIKNASVLLVDDVVTTGATMSECARVLKENGASTVWGMALARG